MKRIYIVLTLFLSVFLFASCTNTKTNSTDDNKTIKIIAPSGAPALSQVLIAHNALNEDFTIANYKISFETTNGAQGVQAAITSQSHDVIIAPINLGAKLFKSNNAYKYVCNITDGNLYFASTSPITMESLQNANLVFFGEGTINQAIINEILEYNGIDNQNITYLADTSTTNQQLVADQNPNTIYLVAEPVLSSARINLAKQNKQVYTIDVQEEFYKASNGMTFLQAGVFVKSDINNNFVETYLEMLEDNISSINEDPQTASNYAEELNLGLPAANILVNAIPGCNLHFRLAGDCKDSLNALVELNPDLFGGTISDEFYY